MPERFLAKPKSRLLVTQVTKRDALQSVDEHDVKFADPTNQKYAIETKEQTQTAFNQISKAENAAIYSAWDLQSIKSRIKAACKKFGVEVSADEQAVFGHDPMLEVTQSHYYIDGSYEDHCSKVSAAFRQWRKGEDCWDYRWSSILGVTGTSVIFYCSDWDSSEPEYYEVGYATDDSGCVTMNGEVQRVDVKLVIERLAIAEPSEQSVMDDTQSQKEQRPMEKSKQQDAVADESVITGAAASATPAQIGTTEPTGTAKTTDAETGGSSVEDPAADAVTAKAVDHSDGEGASKEAADGSSTAAVEEELNKTGAGYKGDPAGSDGTPEPYAGQSDKRPAIQGVSYDQAGQPLCHIQKVTKAEDGSGGTLMTIQGIATRGDIVNQGGQVYPLAVWEQNLPRMNEQAANGKFIGKLEHPEAEQGLVDTAIKFDRFWLQGSDIWFNATVVPTEPHGKNLQALLEAGVQVDMSTRGYGTFAMQDWRGTERPVMQDDFICTAIDAVWHGASTGSGVKTTSYQSDPNPIEGEQTTVEKEPTTQSAVQTKAQEIRAKVELKQTRAALLSDAGLNDLGAKAYQTALDGCDSLETLIATSETLLPHLQATFAATEQAAEVTQSATYTPTFFVKQSQEEAAPKNVGELLDRLVADLPDHYEGQASNGNLPSHFRSPREACKRLMVNVAREQQGSFSGRSAAMGLLALEQGKIDRAQDILTQSLPTGATIADGNADNGGAPLSNYLIFPLIRRVFPMYIMGEIASIQPLDRPEGKIFFLDQYRVAGDASEIRIDLNTSANPFNTSFSDNATEGAAAMQMRLRLTSLLVQAHTKKLGAAWSLEEMQDLRAYHGLDAAQELLGGVAREMALEWNGEVLNDMLAQATAAALTYGTTMPTSGFTQQKDWDEYLWVYLNKLDSAIFSKRNGPMTHIIAGVDAALAMSKSMRGVFTFNSNDSGVDGEIYPGTTFYGTVSIPGAGKYKVLRTNFWSSGTANGSKILGIRKGSEWSDTPYIWSPYTDYVTPMLTDPSDFSQKQGIISRAAKKVVVSDAMGVITVNSGVGELV